MTECVICQHAKVEALQAALNSGRLAAVVAIQFRVKKLDLVKHLQHAPIQAVQDADADRPMCPCTWCRLSPYQRLVTAWEQASQLDRERFCATTREYDVPF